MTLDFAHGNPQFVIDNASAVAPTSDSGSMKESTKDRVKGRIEEAKGKVKEEAGRITRDPDLEDEGTVEKAGGKIQRKVGEIKKVFGQ